MKKRYIKSAVLCLAAIIFTFQFGGAAMAAEVGYTDVSPESPWYDGIEYVTEQGISNGTAAPCTGGTVQALTQVHTSVNSRWEV